MTNIVEASTLIEKPKRIISVSPSIDVGLSGKLKLGVPEGSWVLLSGAPKSGKSTCALQLAANAQEQYDKPVYYGNVEGRIKSRDLQGIHNLDINKVKLIQSEKGNILSAEAHLTEYIKIIKEIPGCILIIDSTSALCEQAEMDVEIKSDRRSSGAKLLASFCRQAGPIVTIQDSDIILIQHMIANTGMSAAYSPFYESGGNKIQFQADVKLRCTSFKQKGVDGSPAYGQVISWKVHTSAIGPPGGKIQSFLRYGHGLDEEMELIMIAQDLGIIGKAASWLSISIDEQEIKAQGEEKLRHIVSENPLYKQYLIKKIEEMI